MQWEVGGTQCTVIALAALLFACSVGPNSWTRDTINHILMEGDGLYRYIIDTLHNGNHTQLLGAHDLPNQVSVFNSTFILDFQPTLFGTVGGLANPDFGTITINDALQAGLAASHFVIATLGGQTIAIFSYNQEFFIFDSHARNVFGDPDPNGFAIFLAFNSFHGLVTYMQHHYMNQQFDITPLIARQLQASVKRYHTNFFVRKPPIIPSQSIFPYSTRDFLQEK